MIPLLPVTHVSHHQIMTLLDAKRGQNLGIFMSGFKMPLAELESALSLLPPQEGLVILLPHRSVTHIQYRRAFHGACNRSPQAWPHARGI